MRKLLFCLSITTALATTSPVMAEIYKSVDAQGHTVFSSQPPVGKPSETVQLQQTNSIAPPQNTSNGSANQQGGVEQRYSVLLPTGLPDDAALRANNGTFNIGVQIVPDLFPGDTLRLIIDGKPYGESSTALSLPVSHLSRGAHTAAIEVLDSNGKQVQVSVAVPFGVQSVHDANDAPTTTAPTPGDNHNVDPGDNTPVVPGADNADITPGKNDNVKPGDNTVVKPGATPITPGVVRPKPKTGS